MAGKHDFSGTASKRDCPRFDAEYGAQLRILLTGCAGFIGARVAALLLESGHSVAGVDSLGAPSGGPLGEWRLERLRRHPGFAFHRLDLRDGRAVEPVFHAGAEGGPVSAVLHLGALAGVRGSVAEPEAYYEVNVLGTLKLLELCVKFGVGRFVLASTSSVYGAEVDGPVAEGADSSRPLSPYAASKKAAETLLYSYHHLHGIDAVALRYFTVYGPAGRPDMSVFKFIRAVAEGEPITVYGDGTQQRDFTYIDDIARGTVAALGVSGYETINLGYGSPVVLNEVIGLIEKSVGKAASIEYRERHAADPLMTWADISRARDVLGWTPAVGIEEGIRRTVAWYMDNREWARLLNY